VSPARASSPAARERIFSDIVSPIATST
jgi:hypothetical protein